MLKQVYIPVGCVMRTVRFGSHCKQNDWQTGVKTLPCPKLRLRAVIILLIPIMIYSSDPWDTFRGTNWGTINNVIRNILSKSVRLKSKQDLIVSHISWIGLKLGAKLIGSIEFLPKVFSLNSLNSVSKIFVIKTCHLLCKRPRCHPEFNEISAPFRKNSNRIF